MQMLRSNNQRGSLLVPALNLDFSRGFMPQGLTFSRASVGTYFDLAGVMQTAANGVPRFDYDPVTLSIKGLLIEESRQNLVLYSEQIDNAFWGKTQLNAVGIDATIAPSGQTTAEKLVPNVMPAHHYVSPGAVSFTSGSVYTISLFLKPSGYTVISIQTINTVFGNYLENRFSLSGSGSVLATASGCTNTIVALNNGWYRISCTATATGTVTSSGYFLIMRDSNTANMFMGDGTSGMYYWGGQIEVGSFPTSYIPTTTVAVTRVADDCRYPGFGQLYSQSEGTLYVNYVENQNNPSRIVCVNDGVGPNQINIGGRTSNSSFLYENILVSSVTTANVVAAPSAAISNVKVCVGIKPGSHACSLNGGALATSSDANALPQITLMRVGTNGSVYANGCIRQIAYYRNRLPDSSIKLLTA